MAKKNLLIACCGSVATIKLPELVRLFSVHSEFAFEIKVITTARAMHFFDKQDLPAGVECLDDADEWSQWQKRGDPVLHIELGKWADVLLLAPLDANTLAKMAQGLCDNLVLCTTRAWDSDKPLLFCPAMNTRMWTHPITVDHIRQLRAWGHIEVPCIEKTLMCGDTGIGAMAKIEDIVQMVVDTLKSHQTDRLIQVASS